MQRTRRRRFLVAAAALAAAPLARAQVPTRLPVLGLLYPNPTQSGDGNAVKFFTGILKEFGWIVGKNIALENASGDGREDRLPVLAEALVQKRVDMIWAAGPEAAVAAARATQTIPIVFYGVGFPVEQGLVDSLAKPGRNVTGLATYAGISRLKGLEVLREIAPGVKRLAWIAVETALQTVSGIRIAVGKDQVIASRAADLGYVIRRHPVSRREDFDAAFAAILNEGADGLFCDFTALTIRERERIAQFANRNRLPSVFGAAPFIQAGGLISYGASRLWMFRHSFVYVDRILRGARPSDLPVEQPTRFELMLNLKTAAALGLAVPQSILLRADRVIE